MAELKNCMLPDSLLYHVDFNVWIQKNEDGTLEILFIVDQKKWAKVLKLVKVLQQLKAGNGLDRLKPPLQVKLLLQTERWKMMPQF